MDNLAAAYRALGRRRLAFKWWQRCACGRDGDAWLEVGYCFHYGLGVRRDLARAASAYRCAARSPWTTEYGREEALYHCAVAELDRGGARASSRAVTLLRAAARDGDYPQAGELLQQLERRSALTTCRCRRGLRPSLGGRAQCARHGSRAQPRQPSPTRRELNAAAAARSGSNAKHV